MADKTDIPTDDIQRQSDATTFELNHSDIDACIDVSSDEAIHKSGKAPTEDKPKTELGNETRKPSTSKRPDAGDALPCESSTTGSIDPHEDSTESMTERESMLDAPNEAEAPDSDDMRAPRSVPRRKHAKMPSRRKQTDRSVPSDSTPEDSGDRRASGTNAENTESHDDSIASGIVSDTDTSDTFPSHSASETVVAAEPKPIRQATRKAPMRKKTRTAIPEQEEDESEPPEDDNGEITITSQETSTEHMLSHARKTSSRSASHTAPETKRRRPTKRTGASKKPDILADMPSMSDIFKSENRVPVILGIITIACLIITVTSFGLRWMAQHGGGTGDPVEASSEVDNTPIPMPHVASLDMVNLSFLSSTMFRISAGDEFIAWDGSAVTGDLEVEEFNTAKNTTMIAIVPKGGLEELVIDFTCPDEQAFLTFSASMSTEDNGALMLTGSANNLPNEGTARVAFKDYRLGVTNDATEGHATPVINVTTSYTVGDGNHDYVGSYVSCSASLSMGIGTKEAYLSTGTRSAKVSAPHGFGHGDILQTGRTTIRQDGRQSAITGTALMHTGEKEYEETYEKLAENDESSKIMGHDVALIDADNNAITNGTSDDTTKDSEKENTSPNDADDASAKEKEA